MLPPNYQHSRVNHWVNHTSKPQLFKSQIAYKGRNTRSRARGSRQTRPSLHITVLPPKTLNVDLELALQPESATQPSRFHRNSTESTRYQPDPTKNPPRSSSRERKTRKSQRELTDYRRVHRAAAAAAASARPLSSQTGVE